MKYLIISFALVAATSAVDEKRYLGYPGAPDKSSDILYQTSNLIPGKSYSYSYGTKNGIHDNVNGVFTYPGPRKEPILNVDGGYRYAGPNGEVVSVSYEAGPQGFVPRVKIDYPGYWPYPIYPPQANFFDL